MATLGKSVFAHKFFAHTVPVALQIIADNITSTNPIKGIFLEANIVDILRVEKVAGACCGDLDMSPRSSGPWTFSVPPACSLLPCLDSSLPAACHSGTVAVKGIVSVLGECSSLLGYNCDVHINDPDELISIRKHLRRQRSLRTVFHMPRSEARSNPSSQ